jgi:hypothetical protein
MAFRRIRRNLFRHKAESNDNKKIFSEYGGQLRQLSTVNYHRTVLGANRMTYFVNKGIPSMQMV